MEALRILGFIANRYQNYNPQQPQTWTGLSADQWGIFASIDGLDINLSNIVHHYDDPPAILTADFDTGHVIRAYLGLDGVMHACIQSPGGELYRQRGQSRSFAMPRLQILPPIGPLERREKRLDAKYVRSSVGTYLAPRHFRNELYLHGDSFEEFRAIAEPNWPHLQVNPVSPGLQFLEFMIRDHAFTGEIGVMGQGLQIWLQIAWFLSRCDESAMVALDEPDVHLHPDIQRRLMRELYSRFDQVIVASHSVDIVAEVDTADVLVVDKTKRSSRYVKTIPQLQQTIDRIGSIHHIEAVRLYLARKILVVEGEDLDILSAFHRIVFPRTSYSLDTVPTIRLDGGSNWDQAIGVRKYVSQADEDSIPCYCLLDRDYKPDLRLDKIRKRASDEGVQLHIWQRNELESYLIDPPVIAKAINKAKRVPAVATAAEIEAELLRITDSLRETVVDRRVQDLYSEDRSLQYPTLAPRVREELASDWATLAGRLLYVPAKETLALLYDWAKAKYGSHLSSKSLVQNFTKSQMPPELVQVLTAVERREPFH